MQKFNMSQIFPLNISYKLWLKHHMRLQDIPVSIYIHRHTHIYFYIGPHSIIFGIETQVNISMGNFISYRHWTISQKSEIILDWNYTWKILTYKISMARPSLPTSVDRQWDQLEPGCERTWWSYTTCHETVYAALHLWEKKKSFYPLLW